MTVSERLKYSQFKFFTIALAFYFFINAACLYPYFSFVYGPKGVIENSSLEWLSDLLGFSSNLSALYPCFFAFLLIFEKLRQMGSVCLLVYYILLFNLNPFSVSPEVEFINFLLLSLALIPRLPTVQGFLSLENRQNVSWVVLGVGYLSAGLAKFFDQGWRSGEQLKLILTESPIATDQALILTHLGDSLLQFANYSVIILESTFFLTLFLKRARLFFWLMMTLTHMVILIVLRLEHVSVGMIIFHFFLFEPNWFFKKKREFHEQLI